MLRVLEERNFPVSQLIPVASENSVGKEVVFKGRPYRVAGMAEAVELRADIALFSAGGTTSLEWAPRFGAFGTRVIDNSSAWRMEPHVKLVVPEVNGHVLEASDRIIANPNCSTIQMVMALAPLHRRWTAKRVIISTYQAVTGTGMKALTQLENERSGISGPMAYSYPIDRNCIPHCDVFLENGYTKEEMKLVNEPRKILEDSAIVFSATAVRVPVTGGHSESVNIEFASRPDLSEVRKLLAETPGIKLTDNPDTLTYPMPLYSEGRDDVFVGRIRYDESNPNAINLWIVADNLRKGAATNAVQIAEYLLNRGWVG
jgi:aspartate-semialdehyde dehydrogenase